LVFHSHSIGVDEELEDVFLGSTIQPSLVLELVELLVNGSVEIL
jgi:hypothetical protein